MCAPVEQALIKTGDWPPRVARLHVLRMR